MKKSVIDSDKVPRCIVTSADGSRIAYIDGDVARVADARTGNPITVFEKHSGALGGLAFMPGGSYLLSGAFDKTARLWDATTGEQVLEFSDATEAIESVAISPAGRFVAVGGHEKVIRLLQLRPFSSTVAH